MLRNKEIKDTLWLMGLQGVNYLAPLLVWPYLMMVLGATQFGVFSFGISLAQYLMLMVDYGFNLTATKQIALARKDRQETDRLFTATMAAKLILLALSAVVVIVVSVLPFFEAYRGIVWITWLMVAGQTFSLFWLFQGFGKVRLVAVVHAAVKLLILPLTFVLVKEPADVGVAAWIQVGVFVGAGIVTVWMTRHMDLARTVPVRIQDIRDQFRSSGSIFLSNAATSTYTTLFVVLLAYFVPAEEVGRYAAAEKLMRCACYLVWVPVSQAYFPKISRLGALHRDEGQRMVRRLTLFMLLAMSVTGILLALCAEPFAQFLGKDYSGLSRLMPLMAVVPLLVGVGGVQGQMGLIALGGEKEKSAFRNVYLAAGVIALTGVCVLAYMAGSFGAAAALVLTEGFVCFAMSVLNAKNRRLCAK